MACSVATSRGRGMRISGRPAAIAPEVTTTTRCPSARAAATSVQSLRTASTSITPASSVIDDVPTLTTTNVIGDDSVLVLEGEAGDVDDVALGRAGLGQR